MRQENVFGKIQPSKRCYELAFVSSCVVRGCVNRIRLWPLRRDDHSGILIGAGVLIVQRVYANDVSTRIDR